MGLISLFTRSAPSLLKLPEGSFTVDRGGSIVVSTLRSGFPDNLVDRIAREVLHTFRAAQAAQLPLQELVIHYSSLRISARELRGGAIVFLAPQISDSPPRKPSTTRL